MKICAVAALSDNRVIGREGKLPWRIPEDLRRFRSLTIGKPVVMGRKTYESIGNRPLPGRTNIVVSRKPQAGPQSKTIPSLNAIPAGEREIGQKRENPFFVTGIEAALDLACKIAVADGQQEIMVIGGGQIYEQALPHAERLYLTFVHQIIEGDAFFPEINKDEWCETAREDCQGFSFVTLERH